MQFILVITTALVASVSAIPRPQDDGVCVWGGKQCNVAGQTKECCPDTFCVFESRDAEKAGMKTCRSDYYAFKLGFGPWDPKECNSGKFCLGQDECCADHDCTNYPSETQTYCIPKKH